MFKLKRKICFFLSFVMIMNINLNFVFASEVEDQSTASEIYYSDYISNQNKTVSPSSEIVVPLFENSQAKNMQAQVVNNLSADNRKAIKTSESGSVSFLFEVAKSGLYNLQITYYQLEGSGASIRREIYIDNKIPFYEASVIDLPRIWVDKNAAEKDKYGNEMVSMQVESPRFEKILIFDNSGKNNQPLLFHLTKGKHTIKLNSLREPMAISDLRFVPQKVYKKYSEVKEENAKKGYKLSNQEIKIEAENALGKSDATIAPLNDRSSPLTSPSSPMLVRYNTIGGDKWKQPGQWIEWNADVKQDGLYTISLRFRQNLKSSSVSYRSLYIDNEIPFEEAQTVKFSFGSAFQAKTLGDNNEPWQFYLTKGSHKVKLLVDTGEFAPIIERVEKAVLNLNKIYRTIIMITGPSPDIYRDYNFKIMISDTINEMNSLANEISDIQKEIGKISGTLKNQDTSTMQRLERILRGMVNDDTTISPRFNDFKNNISGLATWVFAAKEQPLEIDYIIVSGKNKPDIKSESNFFDSFIFGCKQFVASFLINYNSIGDYGKKFEKSTTVWIQTGRDQAQIIRQLINEYFTPKTKIKVNLQLVSMGSLLPATIAGLGPDCSLQLAEEEPLNYAFRGAVEDLSQYEGINDVKKNFNKSALIPFEFDNKIYALPEAQTFKMLFYRKDILNDIGLSIKDIKTWDDIFKKAIPELQKKNLTFGFAPTLSNFSVLLYQSGGSIYNAKGDKTSINSISGVKNFELFTKLYTDYKQPIAFDFANRFRTGEMPLAVVDFTAYNQLTVFAPEINGLWGMQKIPGTLRDDGSVDYSSTSNVSGCVLFSHAKDKKSTWEFMKWWTGTEAQTAYGRELESIMGTAARYNSANIKAFDSVSWDNGIGENIKEQRQHTNAIPGVPGGYFTSRYFDFAFRDVVINGNEVRETIDKTVKQIDAEIKNKREEFKLN